MTHAYLPTRRAASIRWSELEPASNEDFDEREERLIRARSRVAWRIARLGLRAGQRFDPTAPPPTRPDPAKALELMDTLGLDVILPDDPQYGAEHLWGLYHPSPSQRAPWPTPSQIAHFEEQMIREMLKLISRQTMLEIHDRVVRTYFLTTRETRELLMLARKSARLYVLNAEDPEEEKAIMVLKAQELQRRARKSLNIREEGNALRFEAQVRGLLKNNDPAAGGGGIMDIFARVIAAPAPTDQPASIPYTDLPTTSTS